MKLFQSAQHISCRCPVISTGELSLFIAIRLCSRQLLLLQAIFKLVPSNNLVIKVVPPAPAYGSEGSCITVRVNISWLVMLLSGVMDRERLVI